MNCGTKARKNSATLGFSTLVQKPPRKTLFRLRGAGRRGHRDQVGAPATRATNSMRTPTHSR